MSLLLLICNNVILIFTIDNLPSYWKYEAGTWYAHGGISERKVGIYGVRWSAQKNVDGIRFKNEHSSR